MIEDNTCTIPSCNNSSLKAEREGEQITFFTFPEDPILYQKWMEACKFVDKVKSSNNLICSSHFKPEDFEDENDPQVLSTTSKKLKKNALPSLFLQAARETNQTPLPSPINQAQSETFDSLKRQFQLEKDFLKKKIADLENEEYLNKLKIDDIDKKIDKEYAEYESYVKFALTQLPEVDLIEIHESKVIKLKWTFEELDKPYTVTLKHVSAPLYMFMKDTLNYPLPTLPVYKKWIVNMKNAKKAPKIKKGKFFKFKKTFGYLKQVKK